MVKTRVKLVNMGYFTNLALFSADVSMTSLVGHGEVTSADVIGDVAVGDWSKGRRGGSPVSSEVGQ